MSSGNWMDRLFERSEMSCAGVKFAGIIIIALSIILFTYDSGPFEAKAGRAFGMCLVGLFYLTAG